MDAAGPERSPQFKYHERPENSRLDFVQILSDDFSGHLAHREVATECSTTRSEPSSSVRIARSTKHVVLQCRYLTILAMKSHMAFVVPVFATGLLATTLAQPTDLVDFTIVDRVQFSVPAGWPVIADKSTSERTVFAFQIPNAADKGTSDSSNLSITATDLKSSEDRDAFQKQAPNANRNAQEKNLVEGWECSTFSSAQRSTQTEYVIWDCRRLVADCGVSVRVAWPHLPKNPPDYDKQMEAVLSSFLAHVGRFEGLPKSGVVRHPE